jgi:hypothetical protein
MSVQEEEGRIRTSDDRFIMHLVFLMDFYQQIYLLRFIIVLKLLSFVR